MNTPKSNDALGKVILHGQGAGGITAADVERRAREIASTEGRGGPDPTLSDQERALAELSGQTVHPTINDDGQSAGAITRDPSEAPSFFDNQKKTDQDVDEQETVERLALEGVEEAQHDQMLAARTKARRGH